MIKWDGYEKIFVYTDDGSPLEDLQLQKKHREDDDEDDYDDNEMDEEDNDDFDDADDVELEDLSQNNR